MRPCATPDSSYRRLASWTVALALLVVGMLAPDAAGAASSTAASRPGFSAARTLWESEAEMVSSALQNVPLVAAVNDLQRGLRSSQSDTHGYAAAIATLRQFEQIPITSETKRQITESRRDWARLNVFFDLSPIQAEVLDDDLPTGVYFNDAKRAYAGEPSGIRAGVDKELLRSSTTDLIRAGDADQPRSIVFEAAITDLENLAGASSRDIAVSGAHLTDPYRQDIYYLNVYFETQRLVPTTGG